MKFIRFQSRLLVTLFVLVTATQTQPSYSQHPGVELPKGLVPATRQSVSTGPIAGVASVSTSSAVAPKTAIIAVPQGQREQQALSNLGSLHPGASIFVTTSLNKEDYLTSYEKVIIHGHGLEDSDHKGRLVVKLGKDEITPQELADYLRKYGFTGTEVELAACNTGTSQIGGGKSFAEELGEILPIKVVGYPHQIAIKPDGIIRKRGNPISTPFVYEFGNADATPVAYSKKKFAVPKIPRGAPWFPEGRR